MVERTLAASSYERRNPCAQTHVSSGLAARRKMLMRNLGRKKLEDALITRSLKSLYRVCIPHRQMWTRYHVETRRNSQNGKENVYVIVHHAVSILLFVTLLYLQSLADGESPFPSSARGACRTAAFWSLPCKMLRRNFALSCPRSGRSP
jgi:hypothetical protein